MKKMMSRGEGMGDQMSTMKFGVVTESFEREFINSNTLYTVYHYVGQIMLSDATWSKWLDDTTIDLLKAKSEAFDLITVQFNKERSMYDDFAKQMANLGGVYCYENLTWMMNMERYPIEWFDSLEEALKHYRQAPVNNKLSTSAPVKIN